MGLLDYSKAKLILDNYKIKSIKSEYVWSAEEAVKFAGHDSIALKVLSEKALHKSKSGLVNLSLSGEKKIAQAFNELHSKALKLSLSPYKIIAQKMAPSGIEIIIGGRTDPQFGKLLLIGLGGIYVEAFRDFALRVCPITRRDAEEMVSQLRSHDIITQHGASSDQIYNLLLKASSLLIKEGRIKELDLNPVILHKSGYDVVDIRVLE